MLLPGASGPLPAAGGRGNPARRMLLPGASGPLPGPWWPRRARPGSGRRSGPAA